MTLQIGLVGDDGIVIASDRLVNTLEAGDFTRSLTTKVFTGKGVVCCWSGDEAAKYAASYIRDINWNDVGFSDRDSELRKCGDRGWAVEFGPSADPRSGIGVRRKILVGFEPDASLWELDVFSPSTALPILDRTVVGDVQTTIKHLINHYRPASPSVHQLVVLAAHAVCMGHRENSGGIAGLQVVIIPKGQKAYNLTRDQEHQLEILSDSIHGDIGELLSHPFDSRPSSG